jgi:hypothetical protein
MLYSDCQCYPLNAFVILWLDMLSSNWICYPLTLCVIFWLPMFKVSSDSLCYPMTTYCTVHYPRTAHVFLWLDVLSSDFMCYPLTAYVILWLLCCSPRLYVVLLLPMLTWMCYLLMLSSEIITPPGVIIPENFSDSFFACTLGILHIFVDDFYSSVRGLGWSTYWSKVKITYKNTVYHLENNC